MSRSLVVFALVVVACSAPRSLPRNSSGSVGTGGDATGGNGTGGSGTSTGGTGTGGSFGETGGAGGASTDGGTSPGTGGLAAGAEAGVPTDGSPPDVPQGTDVGVAPPPDGSPPIDTTMKLPNGAPCSAAAACVSNFCVDGVCCESACSGQCEACAQPNNQGKCMAVTGPAVGTRSACAGQGTCGASCNGVNRQSCSYPASEKECATANCTAGTAYASSVCDGKGACIPQMTVSCGAAGCAGPICAGGCSASNPCPSNQFCNAGKCFPKQTNGVACTAPDACQSGKCVDGVCCNVACDGACESCGSGTCTPVKSADDDKCVGGKTCDAGGACKSRPGTDCSSATDCATGNCIDGKCCTTSSCGACQACTGGGGICVAVTNKDDDGCAGTCDGTGTCKSKQGQTCGAGCAAGTTCVDGVCCDQACNNPCMACDLSNALGKCTAIPAGLPHGSRTCGTGPCAGSCMGRVDGQCTYPTGSCGTGPTCSGDQVVDQGVCTNGSCVTTNAHPCSGDFACVSGSCKSICASQSDCVSGALCSQGGACIRILSLSAGSSHTCALVSDGSVRCWGEDVNGELGNGLPKLKLAQPVGVVGLAGAPTTVASRGGVNFALFPDGGVWGWGANPDGQLLGPTAPGAQAQYASAVEVTLARGAAQLAPGGSYSCARRADGSVFCWGDSRFTGDPEVVGATQIATSGENVCAVVGGGAVKCWGFNFHGQLGNNATSNTFEPKAQTVIGISGATMVAIGYQYGCALLGDGSVKCWGRNDNGQLGDGSGPADRLAAGPTVAGLSGATAITASPGGVTFTCALTSAGVVKCWGDNSLGQLGGNGLTGVKAISAGSMHACALLLSGQVRCWGQNLSGQLGNGTFTDSGVPVTVTGW